MDIKELLRRKGRNGSQSGISQAHFSLIATGSRRAGPEAIARIAAEIGEQPEVVCAACDESWRRAQASDLAGVDGSHASGSTAGGDQ